MGFVGPLGCGNSTALRMIAVLEIVTRCKVFIEDNLVNDLPPRERHVAMVFQNYTPYPHMKVRENIGFVLKLKKMSKDEVDRRVEEAARILSIEGFLDREPNVLSGGQRQRVALGWTIVREPNAFLMDEPLSSLNAKLRVQMRTEIGKLHNRIGTTTIYVTHDQTEAVTMADRIVLLKDGVVQAACNPAGDVRQLEERLRGGLRQLPGDQLRPCSLGEGTPRARRRVRRRSRLPAEGDHSARPGRRALQRERGDPLLEAGGSRGRRDDRERVKVDYARGRAADDTERREREVDILRAGSRADGAHAEHRHGRADRLGRRVFERAARGPGIVCKRGPADHTVSLVLDSSKVHPFDPETILRGEATVSSGQESRPRAGAEDLNRDRG